MENSELNQLIELLDNPSALKHKIELLKHSKNSTDETEGFIVLYDSNNGDCIKIKKYLNDSKSKILFPLKKKNQFTTYLKYAAVFIVLLSAGIFLCIREDKVASLSHQFEEPSLTNYMSTEKLTNWEDIMFEYKTKNYLGANEKIEKALVLFPQNDTLIYFSGIVNYDLNKLVLAKEKLDEIAVSASVFKDRANYYLGRIAFQKGENIEAKNIFKSLLNSNDLDVKNASFEHVSALESKK
jgi:hypothetical protein